MTKQQYDRWKDFAIRMARTCFKRRRRPSAQQILENVEEFFGSLQPEDIPCIFSWDHSGPYPEGSRYYRRTHRTSCWHCSKRGSPYQRLADCPYKCEDGQIYDYARPLCVGDMCSEFAEQWIPNYWSLSDGAFAKADERWCGPVRCCLRAGLDFASAPSAGVVGFTAGDLRRMYPEGVPEWVTGGDEKWCPWLDRGSRRIQVPQVRRNDR